MQRKRKLKKHWQYILASFVFLSPMLACGFAEEYHFLLAIATLAFMIWGFNILEEYSDLIDEQ